MFAFSIGLNRALILLSGHVLNMGMIERWRHVGLKYKIRSTNTGHHIYSSLCILSHTTMLCRDKGDSVAQWKISGKISRYPRWRMSLCSLLAPDDMNCVGIAWSISSLPRSMIAHDPSKLKPSQ